MGAMLLCRGGRRSSRLASVYVAMTRKFDSACSQWHGVAELMTMGCRPGEAWAAVLVLGRGGLVGRIGGLRRSAAQTAE